MKMTLNAVFSIRPNAEFSVGTTYESLIWRDKKQDKPTEKEFNDAVTTERADYTAKEYQRTRVTSYPPIGDQLDALYHAGAFPTDMAAKIKKVKDDNPKPK